MKLTLIHPAVGKIPGAKYIRAWQMEPLPMAHIAGLTPKDVEIAFFDDRMETINYDAPTDLVALSVETYTARRAYQIASEYRKRGIPVVMGGFHPTLLPNEVRDYAEAVVAGEAEDVWPQLIADFKLGQLKRFYHSSKRPDIRFTMPDRSIFGARNYLPIHLVEAGRGCTFRCDFCVVQKFFNATQNLRSTDTIIEEIRGLRKKNSLIFFVDDNTVSHPEQAKELYEKLIPLKIRWVSQATITAAHDRELLRLLRASGCQGLLVGFESLDSRNLRQMNKSFSASRGGAGEAIAKFHRAGIRVYGTFIFGYDHDTIESFNDTLQFCVDRKLFIVAFNHLTPFPGTPLYERLEAEGRLLFKKWWLDPAYRYGTVPFASVLPGRVITEQCARARKIFYSLPSISRRFVNRAHWGDLGMIFPYFFINLLLRSDASVRYGYPLGDESYNSELITVEACDAGEPLACA